MTNAPAFATRHWYRRRSAVLAAVVLGVLSVSGVAYAYWTTSGSGTGTAKTGTNQSFTITELNSAPYLAPTGMAPGGADQSIYFKINNPMSTNQHVASVTISITNVTYTNAAGTGSGGTTANHAAGDVAQTCSASDFALTQPAAINQDLAPGDTSFTSTTAAIHMIDSASNQDDCKNVTVNLAFSST